MSITNEQLLAELKSLHSRLDQVEAELADLKARSEQEIPEDVLLAISAAVSAYLGNKGKVRAVHFSRHRTWAAQGRQAVQTSSRRL
ncbi:hypothetical protein [Corynebacterium aquilae]|uniref:Methylmalonyl-CoA carboxyltransferase n=1 Tax=Corynebacterium aquilae DSM 44791 TaxID=1431546 RepID=A0A1L7CEL6_9CORY|nr:hypothetical protein [Corynebacterium aquilae]APT84264.1 methylmalonyl-CoA carboxyltransferase [Corynebacterium aquilae DSM 44791]